MSASLSLSSLTSLSANPTPTVGCFPNVMPNSFDLSGLSGPVCAISYPPDYIDIASCCNPGAEVRVENNCTQYCETEDTGFSSCVAKLLPNPPPTIQGGAFCQFVPDKSTSSVSPSPSQTQSQSTGAGSMSTRTPTMPASGTAKPSTTGQGDEPQETWSPPEQQEEGAAVILERYSFALAAAAVAMTFGLFGLL